MGDRCAKNRQRTGVLQRSNRENRPVLILTLLPGPSCVLISIIGTTPAIGEGGAQDGAADLRITEIEGFD